MMIKKKSILTYVLAFMLIIPTMFMLTACGEHKHSYTNEWSMSATEHWHACTDENCTEKQDVAEHTFGEWTITKTATTTSTGEKYRTCSTCGYKETAIIGMVQAYTITWKNANGTILETDLEVLEGSKPEYNGATPTKVEDAVGSWEFKGWKVGDEIVDLSSYNITQNTTFVAEFEVDTYKTYSITFVNDDGTTITTKTYHYNDTIDASDITPTKASSAQYNYTFSGWSPALSNVKGNVTYTAQYTSEERTYTITFVDERDTSIVFATQTYKYGETIDTSNVTPTRETDKYAQYTFAYWSPSLTADTKVTGDTTYRAVFNWEYIYYTVKFVDWDGTEISSGSYYITQELTIPKNPTREADNTYTYNFDKWVDENGRTFNSSSCQGETVYTATYTQEYINYTVTFVDYDDTTLSTKTNYHYGDTVTEPTTTPTRDADNTYTYTFAGWDKEITTVTGDTTYKATYTATYINYTITFVDYNDNVLLTKTDYHYGDTVTAPTTPTRSADIICSSYTFAGWDKEVIRVAGNATYKATYTPTYIDYTIKFVNDDDSVISSQTYHYGATVTEPISNPTKASNETYTYTFAGWDKEVTTVEDNATYKATYTANYINYTITFNMNGGTGGTASATVHYGDSLPTATAPTKSYAVFLGYYNDEVEYYDADMTSDKKFEQTETLVLTAKWETKMYDYTDANKTSIYFGAYPQTKVADTETTLLTELNTKAGTLPTSESVGSWTNYGYYLSGSVSSYMFYIDIDYNNNQVIDSGDYRGVYFTEYRTATTNGTGNYQETNGYTTSTVYWFKFEPIKWNILTTSDGKAMIVSDLLLDSQDYYFSTDYRTDGDTDYQGNTTTAKVYANDYKYSHIRSWLNTTFYDTAFSTLEKAIIAQTVVDNSGNEGTFNSTENTKDWIFLLTKSEVEKYYPNDSAYTTGSDYAKCQGLEVRNSGCSNYWLRYTKYTSRASYVGSGGACDYNADCNYTYYGVRAVCWITL